MTQDIISASLGVIGAVLVALIGLYGAKKAGIGQTQEKLVSSLSELVEAQEMKIALLEKTSSEREQRIEALEKEVAELKRLTIRQARIITKLARHKNESIEEIEWELQNENK